jgi:cell division protein FtsL
MLTRVNVLLAALLMLFSIGLVTSQHRARELFIAVERAQAHASAHEVRWNQLQVEQTELAKAGLIDLRARKELGMQPVASEGTLHLNVDPLTHAVSLSQPWRAGPPRSGARGAGRAAAVRAGTPRPSSVRSASVRPSARGVSAVRTSAGSQDAIAAARTASPGKRSLLDSQR